MTYPLYLDYCATTPVDPQVLEAMLPYFSEHFGNAASRFHAYGWQAEEAVAEARNQIATLLGKPATNKDIVLTSGATESINLAIKGVFESQKAKGNHIVTTQIEHKAVLDTCKHLEKQGAEITYLPVNSAGQISLEQLKEAIKPSTMLISVMAANNETGVIYPIQEMAEIARQNQILFHTDATQAIGKIAVNLENIDLLSFSGHKMYAPKGIGALYVRKGIAITAQQDGGGHERGRRSGTLNVAGIVALGKACEIAQKSQKEEAERLEKWRDKLESEILKQITDTTINGAESPRLPHVSNISFGGVDGEDLLMSLSEIAVSNGSACNSASTEPSYVLKAMGLSDERAFSSIRFSLGRFTQETDIELAIRHVKEVVGVKRGR